MSAPKQHWDGLCKACGSPGPFYKGDRKCKACRYKMHQAWYDANPARARRINADYAVRAHRSRREAAILAYGGACQCCGEREPAFLTIDHIDGGGNAHRRTLTRSGEIAGSSNFYRWLTKAGFPAGFQLLCHNCNFAKSHGGCPHERARLQEAS